MATGFLVRPRLQGDLVTLEVTPHLASLRGSGDQVMDFHSLTTTTRVPLGVWINLGGHLQNQVGIGREILRWGTGVGERETEIWVRVE